jgi:hypothetical protein
VRDKERDAKDREVGKVERENAKAAPPVKPRQKFSSFEPRAVVQQDLRDQVTGQNKENFDADPACSEGVPVEKDDDDDSETAEAVETRIVSSSDLGRRGDCRSYPAKPRRSTGCWRGRAREARSLVEPEQ